MEESYVRKWPVNPNVQLASDSQKLESSALSDVIDHENFPLATHYQAARLDLMPAL